jgi:DNA-nicking Smr family endonuclease
MFYTSAMKNTDQKTALKAIKKKLRSQTNTLSDTVPSNVSSVLSTNTSPIANNSIDTFNIIDDDKLWFSNAVGQVKPMIVDTIHYVKKTSKSKSIIDNKNTNKALAQFHFSDEFEPNLSLQGPMKYVREGVDSFEVKNLRRGHYTPDLTLDLHGLDQNKAKKELAALLFACQKEHAQCICIIHGIGSRILKTKVPHWLVQHPDVMAFHQAPLEWGGNGALLALIELKDKFNRD